MVYDRIEDGCNCEGEECKFLTKMEEVFDELRKNKITCESNYYCCTTCATCAIQGKHWIYFHNQNYDDAHIHGYLYLGYSDIQTAERARMVMLSKGLDVEWDGKCDTKMFVKGF